MPPQVERATSGPDEGRAVCAWSGRKNHEWG
jgi:hypothetical protein